MRLLVVDDCSDIRELMTMLFEGEGFEVATACSGTEALKMLAEGPRPDLVFVDFEMDGGMNGGEFISACGTGIPCVLLTGHESASMVGTGAVEVLNKNIGIDGLLEVVRRNSYRCSISDPT